MVNKKTNNIMNQDSDDFSKMSVKEIMSRLGTSEKGLSFDGAKQRLELYGYNEVTEKNTHPILKLLSFFWGPIPWMIEIAAILSAVIGDWPNFYIILTLLIVNAAVGFWEEHSAGNAIAALKANLALKAIVKRDGKWVTIDTRELVPGDIIRLHIGNIIPADARLLDGDPIEVDQSALTGESLPVSRQSYETVYSGSIVKRGEIDALVYATGKNTFFGKTIQLVDVEHGVSHIQKAILKIGHFLIVVALIMVVMVMALGIIRGQNIISLLEFALILTVASIPVAMPTVLSVTMAIGARALSKKQAIVSRLAAIEELAGMDVICLDKTGTLTQNKLTLGEPFVLDSFSSKDVILVAALASRAECQDIIDLTILNGLSDSKHTEIYQTSCFLPFDPVNKRTEASILGPDGCKFKVTKGAPQVILEMAHNADEIRLQVNQAVNEFAKRGFRSIGVARLNEQDKWRFMGVIPLFDPLREDSKTTLETINELGVKVKILTGDQIAIAKETGRQLGLGPNIMDASLFTNMNQQNNLQLNDFIQKADGFAQVFPEHKHNIVDALQKLGHITGMTGDGVNDAPALKKSDVGIAVFGATDAARSAADIVLMSPELAVIIDAIKESRKIFQRMINYATYRIAETIRVLLFMSLSIMVFNFYPVTAVMIILLALLNDGAILSIAYDNVICSDKPEIWDMKSVIGGASALGVMGVISSFGLLYIGEKIFHLNREMIQALIFLKLSVAGHLTVFLARSKGPFWSSRPSLFLLIAVIGTQIIATFIAVYGWFVTPIGWSWAIAIWAYSLICFFIDDQVKILTYRVLKKYNN